MNKRKIHSVLQETVEEEIPTNSVNLWPKIKQKINLKSASKTKPRLAIRPVFRVAIVLIAAATAFLLTPQGRSLAQEYLLQYFKQAESNWRPHTPGVFVTITAKAEIRATEAKFTIEHPEIPTATPTIIPTPEPGTYWAATKNVLEIEEALGFDVLEPGWLPEHFGGYYSGASADLELGIAYQFYDLETFESNGISIKQYPADLDLELREIGAKGHIDIVNINGYTGEYVEGVWKGTEAGWVWTSDPYLKQLRWEQDGMLFTIGSFAPHGYVTKDDLIAVAESMH